MIKVVARSGLKVPLENNARRYITDTPVAVDERSAYYHRRLHEGDLCAVTDKADGVATVPTDAPEAAALPVPDEKKRGHS